MSKSKVKLDEAEQIMVLWHTLQTFIDQTRFNDDDTKQVAAIRRWPEKDKQRYLKEYSEKVESAKAR